MAVLGRFGRLPAREIAARTAMDKVKVSRAVTLLMGRRLVLRKADRTDARLQWLELSAAGARMHAAIVPMARVLEEELLAGLDDAEVAVLRRALASIGDRLAGEGPD
jgi:DNA-binding MarR family transcriptional regulator